MRKTWFNLRRPRTLIVGLVCLASLAVVPVLIDNRLSVKDNYYTDLLHSHECYSQICAVDFDGDGTLGRVFIDRNSSSTPQVYSLVVRENGQELFRMPYWELDFTARTHVAINQAYASGKSRLLVYERKGHEAEIVSTVYAWNGKEMTEVVASEVDKELFKAMAARDLNGTLQNWLLYRSLRVPMIIIFYLIFGLFLVVLMSKVSLA